MAAASVWLLGDAAIHVQQIVAVGNYSPDNAGIPLYLDVLTPLVLIALPIVYKVGGEGAATPRRALA